ncbi:MAG: CPBP family intramembrane metalloprotease, partial [bacterium]|nr:CPBP family intramembrane metalloprotease [bacterium]
MIFDQNSQNSPPPGHIFCSKCSKTIRNDVKYCPHCGSYQNYLYQQEMLSRADEQWETIKSIIFFYAIYLASVLPLFWLDDDKTAVGILVVSGLDVLIILGYWMTRRTSILPLFRINREVLKTTLLGMAVIVPLLLVNFSYHHLLLGIFGIEETRSSDPFITAGFGFGVIVFSGCVMPAVWEEIAFRGLIQTGLNKKFRKWETLFITSGLFAVIHIAALSWPYLFLVGLVLGILRMKSQSLWP